MGKYRDQLAAKLRVINNDGAFHEDTVPALMILVRKVLESESLKATFQAATLFGDWCVHVGLDRQQLGNEILEKLDAVVANATTETFADRVNESLSLARLRQELVAIGKLCGVDSVLFSSHSGWVQFVRKLMISLVDKPIIRPIKKTGMPARYVGELILEVPAPGAIDPDFYDAEGISPDTVFWRIKVMPVGFYISGPLALTESTGSYQGPLGRHA